jgi:energy-coupling factor transport system permease protein
MMGGATSRRRASHLSLLRDHLDSRAFLAYLAVAFVLAFALQNPLQIAAVTLAAWLVVVGVLEADEYRAYVWYGAITALGVMLLNPLVSRAGETIVWSGPTLPILGPLTVSAEAIVFGIAMGLRLLGVIGLFALYATLVDPDSLYRLVAPISLGSALVASLSIRLFPTTARDAGRISDAMRCRGVALDSGGVLARARARMPVIEALTMTSLDRAVDLAEALESRGHGRPGRTHRPLPALAPRDRALLAITAVLLITGAVAVVLTANYGYYPVVDDPLGRGALAGAIALGLLVGSPLGLEWGWMAWHSSRSRS